MFKLKINRNALWILLAILVSAGSPVLAQETLEERIMALPMWDVHNHLTKESIKAQDFWDLAHYFWFLRELKAVGYPDKNVEISEEERREAFLQALELSKNTSWNHLFRQSLIDLYGVDLKTPEDIQTLHDKIKVTRDDPNWSHQVCDMIGMKIISIPYRAKGRQNGLEEIEERLHYYGHPRVFGRGEFSAIQGSRNVKQAADEHIAKKIAELDEFFANGVRVFRYNPIVEAKGEGRLTDTFELEKRESDPWRIKQYIGHKLLEHLNANQAHLQIFFGMKDMMPDHDQNYMLDMRSLFTMYKDITFEFLPASHENNLDMVQAARSYPNVYPGGMWWLTYRRSVLLENMQVRLEALPSPRSAIVSTDARHIEWVYIKSMMIKRVLVEFMEEQVADGWLTEEEAVDTARWWLYDSIDALYTPKSFRQVLEERKQVPTELP